MQARIHRHAVRARGRAWRLVLCAVAFAAACEALMKLGMDAVADRERALSKVLRDRLSAIGPSVASQFSWQRTAAQHLAVYG